MALQQGCEDWQPILVASLLSLHRLSSQRLRQELNGLLSGQPQAVIDGRAGLVGQFEPDGPAGLHLSDRCAIHRATAWCNIIHADGDHVTAARLAVDRQIEEGQIPFAPFDLELRPN